MSARALPTAPQRTGRPLYAFPTSQMKKNRLILLSSVTPAILAGCTDNDSKSRWHELPHRPEFRQDPEPKEKYELTAGKMDQ